jgi:stage II sporulation protein Q
MKKRKLKPFVTSIIYILSLVMLVVGVYLVEESINDSVFKSNSDIDYVDDDSNEDYDYDMSNIPVVNTDTQIIRPYSDGNVMIVSDYYDYTADSDDQENSILYYENTYMQNSGVDYALEDNSNTFDVISILDGTVTSVSDDDILGKCVEIKYSNDLIGVYQSLGEVNVVENDSVSQGTVIGKSGLSNIGKDMGNHLHFELYYQGLVVNPEEYYGKLLGEL